MSFLESAKQYTGSDLETIFFRPILSGDSARELGVRVLYNMPVPTTIQLWDGQRNVLQKYSAAGWTGGNAATKLQKTISLGRVKAELGFSAADYFSLVYEKIAARADVNMDDLTGTELEQAETALFKQAVAESIRATMVAECRARWGKTPTELFESLGHFDFGGGGFHCVHMTEHDLEIFRDRGLWVITNPGSNAKLASGIAPLRQMRELGIRMAIGTDGPSSNNALDFFREMYLAAVLQKLHCGDAAALPADDVLHMATVGGAQAMGLSDCDVLAPGKQADLIVIDLQRPNMQPVHNAARNLVYSGSKENVRLTMIAGRVLYENGAFFVGEPVQDIYRAVETHFAAMRAAL